MTNTEDTTVSLLYAERDIESLGLYYVRHVVAMTAEKLHNKSDIVAELAYRDQALQSQQEEIASLKADSVCNRETELLKEVERLTDEKERLEYDYDEVAGLKKHFKAKAEQLTEERDDFRAESKYWKKGYEETEDQVTRMRKALEKYGRHLPDCVSNALNVSGSTLDDSLYMPCSCRFEQALQNTPELPRRTLRKSASVTDEQRKKAYDAAIVSPEGGCEHGRDMTEDCLECGRINGGE